MDCVVKLLQGNLNHCRGAQDLLMQTLAQESISLAVVAEPYNVPDHPRWFRDEGSSIAIHWAGRENALSCTLLEKGHGLVAVEWGRVAIIGCYVSPNCSLADYELYLYEVRECIRRCLPRPTLIMGDFNAHSLEWGCARDNIKGQTILEWAAELDLRLLNRGVVSTCVRWQGESVVDLSWATPSALSIVSGWRVADEIVTLSDHRHIVLDLNLGVTSSRQDSQSTSRRWSLKSLNRDMLEAAAITADWVQSEERSLSDPESTADMFREVMTSICDASMPRVRPVKRKAAYWWNSEISQLREHCLRSRRQFTRARRRRSATVDEIRRTYEVYRNATKSLQLAIAESRSRSWGELLQGLDRDPWGRPYKMVLGKLRPCVPPLTETLDPSFVEQVAEALFPRDETSPMSPSLLAELTDWSEDRGVTEAELSQALARLNNRNSAPGPDGIPGRVWVLVLRVAMSNKLTQLFNNCFRCGVFPGTWKEAKLVLLKKNDRPISSLTAYRPICLLDEAGKLFEKIIAGRIGTHLRCVGPDLSDSQFGFRRGLSTIDAVLKVREITKRVVARGGVALAVSLDIVNAFNTLPWDAIKQALYYHGFPLYLQRVIGAYLQDRHVQYKDRDGMLQQRRISCGVPQGSVMGPLLWNLAYDAVLRVRLPAGIKIICYADDTLVLAEGNNFEEACRNAELGVSCVMDKVHELGLTTAPHKTEALWFHGLPRTRDPPRLSVRVGNTQIEVGQYMKYLGLTLDSRWGFEEHFSRTVPRIKKVAGALHRLLPNLGGPRDEVRRLYAGVVRSMALYGAPVWSARLSGVRRFRVMYNSMQRIIAIRIARGYRTISFEAATLLARFPPLDILAEMDARVYDYLHREEEMAEDVTEMRRNERLLAHQQWSERLHEPRCLRQRIVAAILPQFETWIKRRDCITYRLTQILTGHGCFGEYLNRIGREPTASCHHCGGERDSAQHTLGECPAWSAERQILFDRIGQDLSLPNIIAAMLADETTWQEVVEFCEAVLLQKETAERERERTTRTQRRRGRGRNTDGLSPLNLQLVGGQN